MNRINNLAASGEKTRYYLKCVYVEVAEKTVTYTATDGKVLLSRREDCAEPNTLTGSWIIPSDFIKSLKPSKHTSEAVMTIAPSPNYSKMLAFTGSITGMAAPIDGTFPDYRRIIPATVDGKIAQFDGHFMGLLAKFGKALGLGYFTVHHNGDHAAPVTWERGQGTFAVVMPVRVTAEAWDPS